MFEGGWRALLGVATLHRSVESGPSHTQRIQPLSGQPWGLTFRKLDEIRNTGRRGKISCSREAGEPCWLLLHSTGSVGSGPAHTQLLQPLSGQPWGLTFRKLDEMRSTGRRGPMSCSREAGEPCWLLPHSTGLLGQGHHKYSPSSPSVDSHGA